MSAELTDDAVKFAAGITKLSGCQCRPTARVWMRAVSLEPMAADPDDSRSIDHLDPERAVVVVDGADGELTPVVVVKHEAGCPARPEDDDPALGMPMTVTVGGVAKIVLVVE